MGNLKGTEEHLSRRQTADKPRRFSAGFCFDRISLPVPDLWPPGGAGSGVAGVDADGCDVKDEAGALPVEPCHQIDDRVVHVGRGREGVGDDGEPAVDNAVVEVEEALRLSGSPAQRRMAVSLAGRDLSEAARGRAHRLGGGDNRGGRQHGRQARDRGPPHRADAEPLHADRAYGRIHGRRRPSQEP